MRRTVRFSIFFIFFALLASACSKLAEKEDEPPVEQPVEEEVAEPAAEPTSGPTSQAAGDSVKPTAEQVEARVAAAKTRLEASEGGTLIWAAIKAHGGLSTWFENGPVGFRFAYKPVEGAPRDTYQVIDQWGSRAVHEMADNREIKFGWDGQQAWHTPVEGDFPMRSPRFWALTPYYFMGVPFVFADPGTEFELLTPLPFEGVTYDRVKVTFTDGTGDAPDDYYIVFLNQKTRKVGGVTYIVSYPGFFKDGGHSDPKFMSYDGSQTVAGLTFPETFRTFKLDGDRPTDLVTNTTLSDLEFRPALKAEFFAVPEGAVVVEGY